ncbi:MAG: ketopantoate reductase family protein, partial [Anaerolineae bacterium]
MKIAVVGAGAMGSLFGGLLAESGYQVWLYDIRVEQIEAINQNGLTIEKDGHSRCVDINATSDPNQIERVDLAILFVKSPHTRPASDIAGSLLGSDGLVLTLQNGIGNVDIIAETIAEERIVAGTTSHGATLLAPGRIRHAGTGATIIGMWAGKNMDRADRIAGVMTRAGIETEVVQNVQSVIWNKLLINVGINAITALTGIKNGEILDLEITRNLSRAAVEEAMSVARAQAIEIDEDAVRHVLRVAKATKANRSSMGQDVDNKRLTEIDAINGAVVRIAEKLGLKVPVNL